MDNAGIWYYRKSVEAGCPQMHPNNAKKENANNAIERQFTRWVTIS